MKNASDSQIKQFFIESGHYLITSHIRPDGDAIGSLLGLGLALQSIGKKVQMVLKDGVPASFSHLIGSDQVSKAPQESFETLITVDCADFERTGFTFENHNEPDLNIDHHLTNQGFAKLNLVEPDSVAASATIAAHLEAWGLGFTQPVAEALLTGLVTDTLGFRTSNMHPEVMSIAAKLMELGANLPDLYQKALLNRSFEAASLWGKGLNKIHRDGNLVWTTLTRADAKAVNYPGRDDADLINVLSSINEADIAMIFIEQSKDQVKVSWRARPGFDVSKIATAFGGGGHKPAAGATIDGELKVVMDKVIKATQSAWAEAS
jgi:phosphoesterase RecJ-like protein